MTKTVIAELSAIPEKFLENDLKDLQPHSQGCLYPYLETKKLLDGSNIFYPRVIGERDPNNPFCWRWGFNWKEKHNGVWKSKSIGSIPPGAVHMIRTLQQLLATRENIIAFIKKAKTKKTSPKLDICKNFDDTKLKPVLPNDAAIAVVLFSGGGGIEAGMVQAGIRPAIAVEFDPTKPELSQAIAIAEAIRKLQPQVFTLENVPRYQNSQSFSIILSALEQEGYSVDYSVVNMADFGLPQARRRLVLIASKGLSIALPLGTTPCSWYEFPNETATAGSIIGYSVPPSFATQLFISAQSKLLGVTV